MTITFVCDDREDDLSFEIFVETKDRKLSISNTTELYTLEHDKNEANFS